MELRRQTSTGSVQGRQETEHSGQRVAYKRSAGGKSSRSQSEPQPGKRVFFDIPYET